MSRGASKPWILAALVALLGFESPASRGAVNAPPPAWVKLGTVPYTLNNKQDAVAFVSPDVGWYGNGLGRIYLSGSGGAADPGGAGSRGATTRPSSARTSNATPQVWAK